MRGSLVRRATGYALHLLIPPLANIYYHGDMKRSPTDYRLFVLLILWQCCAAVFIARLNFLATLVTVPYLMQHGYTLYDTITIQYTPGLFWLNSALATVFTDPQTRLYLSQFALIGFSTAILYKGYGKRAAIVYAAWSPIIMQRAFYFENVVGLLLLVVYWQRKRAFLCGVLLGLAILVKQQTVLAAGWYLLWQVYPYRFYWRRLRSVTASAKPSIG